jgi:biotin transport system permease protein
VSVVADYVAGGSPVHRMSPGAKLLAVVALAVVLTLLPAWWHSTVALAAVLGAYVMARVPIGLLLAQVRALLWVLLAVCGFQVVVAGWRVATDVVLTFLTLVLAAGLVSLTTTATALTGVVVRLLRPFRRFGVAPERIGVLIALSVRSVPVVIGLAQEIRDAQRARGRSGSARAFAVPLLVRSLRHAERLGEALVARGFDD